MREQILDECSRRGTCPLNRKQFDETFTGRDLAVQIRSANDFAQQNGLAFGRSTGDQFFVFSRLPKLADGADLRQQQRAGNSTRQGAGHSRRRRKHQGAHQGAPNRRPAR